MKYVSTRGAAGPLGLSEAIQTGLAPDGGLYVPERFPAFEVEDFGGLDSLPDIAGRFLAPFFEGDALSAHLPDVCREAFNFPVPLVELDATTAVLELFHGPTAAFKDVGARFLAACVSRLPGRRTVLVATSGDTGGAVAPAFAGRGDFDDCQRVVKTAFADRAWAESQGLLSANSINLGRLLPQTVYY